jgi:hypothetical protein
MIPEPNPYDPDDPDSDDYNDDLRVQFPDVGYRRDMIDPLDPVEF